MDQGEDTWCNVMGEVGGFRLGLSTHLRPPLQVSKQKPVGVAAQIDLALSSTSPASLALATPNSPLSTPMLLVPQLKLRKLQF